MVYTRRDILKSAAVGTAAALPGLGLAASTAEARAPLKLGPWKYGGGSYADDTVLMFRGNPAHTFYGTGPLPDGLTELWRFPEEPMWALSGISRVTHDWPLLR